MEGNAAFSHRHKFEVGGDDRDPQVVSPGAASALRGQVAIDIGINRRSRAAGRLVTNQEAGSTCCFRALSGFMCFGVAVVL